MNEAIRLFNEVPNIAVSAVRNDFIISATAGKIFKFSDLTILKFADIYALEFFNTPNDTGSLSGLPNAINVADLGCYVNIVDRNNNVLIDGLPIGVFCRVNSYDKFRLDLPCDLEVDWQKSNIQFGTTADVTQALTNGAGVQAKTVISAIIYYRPVVRQNYASVAGKQ